MINYSSILSVVADKGEKVMVGKIKKCVCLFKTNKKRGYNYFRWLLKYTSPYKWKIAFLMAIQIGLTYLSIYYAIISQRVVDSAGKGQINTVLFALYAMLAISQLLIIEGTNLMSAMLNEKYSFGIRKQIYEKILHSTWEDSQRFHTGDMMTRMTSDAGNIATGMVSTVPHIIILVVQLVSFFFTLFHYSHFLAVAALFLTPFGLLFSWILGKKLKKLQVKVQETETNYRSFIQESLANLLVVKAFSAEDDFSGKLTVLRNERFFWVWKKNIVSSAATVVLNGTFSIGMMIAFIYSAIGISKGTITFGILTLTMTLFGRIQTPIMGIASQFSQLATIFASAGRVIEIQNFHNESIGNEPNLKGSIGVQLNNVSFSYKGKESSKEVLSNVNIDIEPGESIAIVGKSGVGKTTLVRLIMHFLEPLHGSIVFYDCFKNSYKSTGTIRKRISYVPQGNTLFSGTILENLKLANKNASMKEIDEALHIAVCDEFISKLPNGLNTKIGEKGSGLSEGQAQRIAIARALLRKSPFIVFDEATSALDEDTEIELLKNLNSLVDKPTCLLITHRKAVLKYCNKEICIKEGKVSLSEVEEISA